MSILIPEDIIIGLRKHGFMVLPFEPNEADVGVILTAMRRRQAASRSCALDVYEALVARHRAESDVKSPNIPSRNDKDLD